MRYFNTEGLCIPHKHYMVDISDTLAALCRLVEQGKYFTINRGRQYGKTTTLHALCGYLKDAYEVLSLDFQAIGEASFRTEGDFVQSLAQLILDKQEFGRLEVPEEIADQFRTVSEGDVKSLRMGNVLRVFLRWCRRSEKPVVLIIDEVDSATNNQVFLDFLAQLRFQYLEREKDSEFVTFQSVILAGVTDVRHLKSRIRSEDQKKVNSPWNIAVDFTVDMSLPEDGIYGMLLDYEADHHTGMDAAGIAKQIRDYTGGYPYLVSKICQILDQEAELQHRETDVAGQDRMPTSDRHTEITEQTGRTAPDQSEEMTGQAGSTIGVWTVDGVDEAVRRILSDGSIMLFESLTGKLINFPELREKLREILLLGEATDYYPYDDNQQQLLLYGFIRVVNNKVVVANRIFEMLLYRMFIGENRYGELRQMAAMDRNIFIEDGRLNVPKIMEHFIASQKIIRGADQEKFVEDEGRERFLTYLSPIINGTGTYSIEEQTRDRRRMDVVIHYLGRRYVIELKIWHGERYNERGERQLRDYLDYFGLDTGYMLSFNFNQTKETGVKRLKIGNKVLYEGIA